MIKTNIGAIIKTRKYDIKEVIYRNKSGKIKLPKSEEGKYYSIVPLFDDTILKIKKIDENDYTLLLNNLDCILTKEVKKSGITLSYSYVGLNVLIFPAPIEY